MIFPSAWSRQRNIPITGEGSVISRRDICFRLRHHRSGMTTSDSELRGRAAALGKIICDTLLRLSPWCSPDAGICLDSHRHGTYSIPGRSMRRRTAAGVTEAPPSTNRLIIWEIFRNHSRGGLTRASVRVAGKADSIASCRYLSGPGGIRRERAGSRTGSASVLGRRCVIAGEAATSRDPGLHALPGHRAFSTCGSVVEAARRSGIVAFAQQIRHQCHAMTGFRLRFV